MNLKQLISEALVNKGIISESDCNCGPVKRTKAPILNENLAPREILSEGLQYHIDNKKPLTEHVYRAGSQAYFNLWAEARSLYTRGILDFYGDDLSILTETHLGEFGLYEGKKVPLDFIFEEIEEELNENTHPIPILLSNDELEDELRELGLYSRPSPQNQKRYKELHDEFERRVKLKKHHTPQKHKDEKLTEAKDKKEDRKYIVMWREGSGGRWVLVNKDKLLTKLEADKIYKEEKNHFKFKPVSVQIFDYMDFYNKYWRGGAFPNVYSPEKFFLLQNQYPKDLTESKENKPKKKNPPIGKPKRGGSKKFYVYVRDKGKIKKVSFGQAGMSAKINNPKARAAFSKRHNCPQKKDKTKASYWSCRLPRYAKLLGLKSNFSGFW